VVKLNTLNDLESFLKALMFVLIGMIFMFVLELIGVAIGLNYKLL
jgi:hypothetical protein